MSRAKGMRTELKCQKELEKDGWLIQRAPPPKMFSKQTDLYGLWDIMAIKHDLIEGYEFYDNREYMCESILRVKFIQVKTNRKPNLKPFKAFKNKFLGAECEVWIWYEKGKAKKWKGWRKIII